MAAIIAIACLTGCPDERKPFPYYQVTINADGSYLLDGKSMNRDQLRTELSRRAADPDISRQGLGNRANIRITTAPGTGYAPVQDLVNELNQLGFQHIETVR